MAFIDNLRNAGTAMQAIAVSIGGLLGVFTTLAFFFLMILAADRFSKHK
ncbi:MAG TPA: hypothetical protein PLS88_01910 [Rectinema sp.]|jgi:hypothetical protein|nr:hypothetical protein [Spirochaetia bacterium]HOH04807.1 hypothetical protein [Rectinema sp.]HOM91966.1 hypothetical protein [Rectinema sp.]HOU06142.1 hypothetical protein [Rectinema sp.]HQE67901.1 hypothetical protein [Rectinema sp.]